MTRKSISAPSKSMEAFVPMARLLVLCVGFVVISSGICNAEEEFYSAYKKYPEYCSTTTMMAERTIPPLKHDPRLGETRLVHVTASIRHGARTPADGGRFSTCWDGYWDNPVTGNWNCKLKAESAPPTPYHEKQQEGNNDDNGYSNSIVLFEKNYDALMDPKNDLSNGLFGTCQTGQLLVQGYEQHTTNGKLLRDAYTYTGEKYDHDIKMRLIDLKSKNSHPWGSPQVILRSDDDSRVLMSGQVLVQSLFEKEIEEHNRNHEKNDVVRIPVHLADRNRDIVAVNEEICPRLTEMRQNFERTSIFKSYNNSKEAKELRKFMKNQLKAGDTEIDILGCLLPTVCTDKPLPEAFDYDNSDIFDRMIQFAYKRYNMHLLANDGEFSKLAMAPLWSEILDKIGPIIRSEKSGDDTTRLFVVSGHDDTVAPLMASLNIWDDTAWPAYATMFLIEIHEIIDGQTDRKFYSSKFAFRLIYNGSVITNQVEGCLDDAELCDVKVLTDILGQFVTRQRDCQKKGSGFFLWSGSSDDGGKGISRPFANFLFVVLGAVLGGLVMSYYITGSFFNPKTKDGYKRGESTFSDGGMSMPSGSYSDDPEPVSYHNEPEKGFCIE